MHSEKLKQLVKDKVPLKFRIKNEQQSKELQDFFFALDVFWKDGDRNVSETNKEFLFLGDDSNNRYYLTMCDNNESCCWLRSKCKEFDLENDCLVEECKWPNLKKLVEAKVRLKFRIKNEQQSKEIHDFLSNLDIKAGEPNVEGTQNSFLFIGYYNQYTRRSCFYKNESCCFADCKNKEFDLENDCLVKEETIHTEITWNNKISLVAKLQILVDSIQTLIKEDQ